MKPERIAKADHLYSGREPGIYFGLTDDRYHEDPALGSSKVRQLLRGIGTYWFDSYMNPARPREKETDAKTYGKAIHKLTLEGVKEFERFYKRRPDDPEGISSAEKGALTKHHKKLLKSHERMLKGEDYDAILMSERFINANPDTSLVGGASEVSVFWTYRGIPLKARFDKLRARGFGDLKSLANERGRDLEEAVRLEIRFRRHDIQGRIYLDGFAMIPSLLAAGKVFGAEAEQHMDLLHKCALRADEASAQFVYYQKEGTPEVFSVTFGPDNTVWPISRDHIDLALARFRTAMEKFGEKEMWITERKVKEFSLDDMPNDFGRIAVD